MCDNLGEIFLNYNTKNGYQTNHIDIWAHFVCLYVEDGIVKVIFVRSSENKADTFTKNLSGDILNKYRTKNLTNVDCK